MRQTFWLNWLAICSILFGLWPIAPAQASPPPLQALNTTARPTPIAPNDNNILYHGLGHDSQDTLYRVPFGALPLGLTVTLRFRTIHNDVTTVQVRVWDTTANAEFYRNLAPVATDVSCYATGIAETCDYWSVTLTPTVLTTYYYRFIITDGTATAYYADDRYMNGGWGEPTPNLVDNSYALVVYDPAFTPIPWLQNAVVYQIFPDRFHNGDRTNDPKTGDVRYDESALKLDDWSLLPEGYCRKFTSATWTNCPWRFGPPPPWAVPPTVPVTLPETPRGRDYYGGDLQGVIRKLDYLQALGVTAIYFNPIFDAGSNHLYDTQEYTQIDPYFGTQADWDALVVAANARNMRLIVDGVFNHVSSDSLYFDRYHHYPTVGACESITSTYRTWFYFQDVAPGTGTCAGPNGPNSAVYSAWFGFDSLPVLNKNNNAVRAWIYGDKDSVARHWLFAGAAGWRLDVMGDPSFPNDYWQQFRQAVKSADPEAPIIGELWKKGEMVVKVQGDQADTGMNYRFRNAILGFLGTVDDKGFPDDGESWQTPTLFAEKMLSTREDYPDAAYYTLMNLLDSHDTQRILWLLTPGNRTREDKEFNAANLTEGKRRLLLATLIQMTTPGAPTIYYGNEVGVTGDDDPDDRRTFPWLDVYRSYLPLLGRTSTFTGSMPIQISTPLTNHYFAGGDHALLDAYRALTALRANRPVFREGDLSFLLTDNLSGTLAYQMRTLTDTAIVAINRYSGTQTLSIPFDASQLPNGLRLYDPLNVVAPVTTTNGFITVTVPAMSGVVLVPQAGQDLTPPAAPLSLSANSASSVVVLNWNAPAQATAYSVYRSPVTGGGYVRLAQGLSSTAYTDTTVVDGRAYYYVITAHDAAGNESVFSNEAEGRPALAVLWAIVYEPATITHTLGVTPTAFITGFVSVPGITDLGGDPNLILAQVGYGPFGTDPVTWTTWVNMTYTTAMSQTYGYRGNFRPEQTGTSEYVVRFSTNSGATWKYAGLSGPFPPRNNGGTLLVQPNPDTTPPAAPTLSVAGTAASFVALQWTTVADAAEYWLYRSTASNPTPQLYTKLNAPTTLFTDTNVTMGTAYTYTVKAIDFALNPSADSNAVTAVPTPRNVQVTFNVTTPASTPVTRTVYIVGNQPQICNWCDPHTVALTQTGANTWSITLTFSESTSIEYKYTLGSWNYVEKDSSCNEIGNRQVTVGNTNITVTNTVANWRNVPPCGN